MNQWKTRQINVNNAFLNRDLMDKPESFIDAEKSNYMCKLHKSLYGFKQAPKT